MSAPYEREQRDLNPNRTEEERHARQEAEYRLSERGVRVDRGDTDEEVADLLDAIERFEAAVEAKGGDLFVNRIGSSEPEDPAYVPPERREADAASDYRLRIERATDALRRR